MYLAVRAKQILPSFQVQTQAPRSSEKETRGVHRTPPLYNFKYETHRSLEKKRTSPGRTSEKFTEQNTRSLNNKYAKKKVLKKPGEVHLTNVWKFKKS